MVAAPYAKVVAHLQTSFVSKGGVQEPCSTGILRSLNVILAAAFFSVVQQLYRRLHSCDSSNTNTLMVRSPYSDV